MRPSDAFLRELVILEHRSYQVRKSLQAIGSLLSLDYKAGSVSAMRDSIAVLSASKHASPAEPELPF